MKLLPFLWYVAITLLIISMVYVVSELQGEHIVDASSRVLCRDYAIRDRRLEIGEKRFEYLKQYGDPNDTEFFYKSCLNHLQCPVATECVIDNNYMEGNK